MTRFQKLAPILEFNFAMVLMGTSGALGRFIVLPPILTICLRCFIAAIFLGVFCKWRGVSLKVRNSKDLRIMILLAVMMVTHWISYFVALQKSSVAIGMLSLFTYPVFTAILEPIFLKTKLQPIHLLFSLLVIVGVSFLAPSLDFGNQHLQGILYGLTSSLIYSCRNLILKTQIQSYSGMPLMFFQLVIGGVILSPVLFFHDMAPVVDQWMPLLALGVITTAIGHTMFVIALNHFSVTTISIMSTVQPIYGIVIGIIFLSEFPEWRALIGGALILSAVVAEAIRHARSQ